MTEAVDITDVPVWEEMEDQGWRQRLRYVGKLLARDRSGMLGLVLFLLVCIAALFSPWIAPHDPLQQNLRAAKQPPAWTAEGTWEYPLGTDSIGRDVFSRIIYGSRVSLTVGFFGVLIASSLGLLIGLVAGYLGGRADNIIMGFVNLLLALPYLLLNSQKNKKDNRKKKKKS